MDENIKVREGQISEQLNLVRENVKILQEYIEHLEIFLLPILVPSTTEDGVNISEPKKLELFVPMASEIYKINIDLTKLNAKINSIRNNVEL